MYRGAKIDMSLYACTLKRTAKVSVYIFLVLIAWKCLGNIYTKTNFYERNQVLDYTDKESHFGQTSSGTFDLSPIEFIRQDCGELCDTDRPGTTGPYFDHITAKINCNALFTNKYIDREHGQKKAPKEIPKVLWNEFTMNNRLEVVSYYFDEHSLGKRKHMSVPIWTQSEVNGLISKAKKGRLVGNYGVNNTNALRDGLKHAPGVKNGRVLVIGSVKPWAEACVLEAGAREIVTLEYGKIVSHIPNVKTMVPYEFRMAYLNKTLGEFDAVVTFSSVEHSGLGRYGDALNPWGDIIAVARGWCVTKEGGSLTIGVEYNNNQDYIRFNADRCYGKISQFQSCNLRALKIQYLYKYLDFISKMRKTHFKRFIVHFLTILMLFYFIRYFVLDFQSELKTNRRTVLNNDSNVALVLQAALQINDHPVLITLVNDGYLDMVQSWVCNTKLMGFHKQVIMITTSANATEKIKYLSPDITVVVLNVDKSMNEHQVYSHVGYVKIMILRTQIQLALLQNDIELYSFECDSVFLANPLPTLRAHSKKHDIVFISNYKSPKAINGGFLYLFPTPATKATFKQLNKMMLKLSEKIKFEPSNKTIPTYENDQVYLSNLVFEKYAGLKSIILPFSVFPDGKWYEISEKDRKMTKPYLIHNNWIMGNKAKEERARKWGHWFLKEDGSCDVDAVNKII